jgi:hypothetical protein
MEKFNFKLNQSNGVLQQYFDAMPHQTFQKGRNDYWDTQVSDKTVSIQGFCWLYCWAKTGQGSKKAKDAAAIVFEYAFGFAFSQVDRDGLHTAAKVLRYQPDSDDCIQILLQDKNISSLTI